MASSNLARVDVPDTGPMGELGAGEQRPLKAIVLKLRFRMKGEDELDIYYSGIASHSLATADGFKVYLEKLVDGQEPGKWSPPNETQPVRSPLSIANRERRYIVVMLDKGNWQYSQDQFPFQVQEGRENFYVEARAAWRSGGQFHCDKQPPEGAGARVAYFIAKSEEDLADQGGQDFRTPFNIYVDLVLRGEDGRERLLPIAIDPDVGHPGGNE